MLAHIPHTALERARALNRPAHRAGWLTDAKSFNRKNASADFAGKARKIRRFREWIVETSMAKFRALCQGVTPGVTK